MNEKPSDSPQTSLSEADQLRFEQDLPQWLAGHLPPEQAQWMEQMKQLHEALARQVEWLGDARAVLRAEVAQEDTQDAWALLSRKLMQEQTPTNEPTKSKPSESSESSGPRWLKWLQIHPGWANVAAAAAVVLIVGQAGWIVSRPDAQISTAGWRSLDIDDLHGAATSSTQLQVQLKPDASVAEMAKVESIIRGLAINSDISWRMQSANVWALRAVPAVKDEQALVDGLKALPFVEQARAQPQQ